MNEGESAPSTMPASTAEPLQTPAPASQHELPKPRQQPGADVVIYDGNCPICTAQVRRLERWDGGGRLAFLSLHDSQVAIRYPDLMHDQLMQDMYVVDGRGQRHRGAAAIRYLSRRLPRLWWLAPLLHIPFTLPLWQWLYRQFAGRRYHFGHAQRCDDRSCGTDGRR